LGALACAGYTADELFSDRAGTNILDSLDLDVSNDDATRTNEPARTPAKLFGDGAWRRIRAIRADPEQLLRLSPREFEEAMAAFYEDRGWQVQLTPERKDGGKDLIIVKSDEAGRRMCYVECKRYARDHPVSVGIIRELWGVVDKDNATSGIVAATSYFTKGAREESQSIRMAHRMALYDYDALVTMLRSTIGGAGQ
jgi:HJR/Mrr/RecB family endonuclease